MINLRGHRALITGSTQGVGRAIAEAFVAAGCDVVVHGLDRGPGVDEQIARFRGRGVEAAFVACDLAAPTPQVIDDLFARATAALPGIDVLVNNAGTCIDKPYLDIDRATFDHTMGLNVTAPYFLTQRFARHWVESGVGGRVLMIGSINGRLAEPKHTCYDTSKGAVEMMVKSLCVALAPLGIRVNGLAPGLVRTPLTAALDSDPEFDRWMRLHTPNGQVPGAEVCGSGAVYLCSDEAWHVHGQMLLIDGGMSAWQQPDLPRADMASTPE
jgi:NAD(P)-dependent dehydrogenase (short-subunit alcohol dehydrogenase family)